MNCIYCSVVLEGDVRPAHIIPKGMGGRLVNLTTVCHACNNSFSKIEGDACHRLASHGALIGARRGDGTPITAVIEYEGSKYRAGNGRMYQLAPPPADRGRVHPMPALREDQVKVIVRALSDRKLPPEAILDGRFRLEDEADAVEPVETRADPAELSLTWCDRLTKRFMMKVAIEFLARTFPTLGDHPKPATRGHLKTGH